jgi:hypothetical protein
MRLGPEVAAGALAVLAAGVVGGRALGTGFPLDDAWIHMVYGAALRHTASLAYDDGRPSTGCTSAVWAAVVALAHGVAAPAGAPSLRVVACVQAFGATLHGATAVLAARTARAWAPRRSWAAPMALAAGALVAGAPTLAYAAVSGMEVSLTAALLLGVLGAASRRRWLLAGALAGVASITRPEAALAVAVVSGLAAAIERPRVALRAMAAGLLPLAARVTRDYAVSGRPLPATFYVKANPTAQPLARSLHRGLIEVLGGMRPASSGLFWACLLGALGLGAVALARRIRGAAPARRPLAIGAAAALGLTYAGGISALSYFENPGSFYYQRYVAPPLPLMIVAGLAAAAWLARLLGRVGSWPSTVLWGLAAAGVAHEIAGWSADRARFAADVAATNAQQVAIGRWLDAQLPPGAVVWTIDAGAIRYWGRRPTVDLVRLNTPDLFDGTRVKKGWSPSAIVTIPATFQVATSGPLLDVAFVAHAPAAPPDRDDPGRQEVYRCRRDADHARDNRVLVLYRQSAVIAAGHCVP